MTSIIQALSESTGMTESWVRRVCMKAPYAYKEYRIPKRSGGWREIAQPSRETKLVQGWIIKNILREYPVHDAAMAYREGRSIRSNAEVHVRSAYLAKLDFKDFFPSIKGHDLGRVLVGGNLHKLSAPQIDLVVRVCFRKKNQGDVPFLSIGAPSSPIISNIVMYAFDEEISRLCAGNGILYTRYADDMTFSTNRKGVLFDIPAIVEQALKDRPVANLVLNQEKTVFLSKKGMRQVTGLVLSNDGSVSIGRDKKRELRALVHQFLMGKSDLEFVLYLRGMLAYVNSVDAEFVVALRRKYGDGAIDRIFRA